jgi:UPF0716 protein FxsA
LPLVLFALFVIIPILEIATFIQVGSVVGLPLTLLGILLTAVIGAFLVRQQGFKAINDAKANLESQKSPVEQVIHGAFILVAGLLLLTPGFLTDAIGFLFLFPPARLAIAGKIWAWLKENASISSINAGPGGPFGHSREQTSNTRYDYDEDTIEGEAVEIDPKADQISRYSSGQPPKTPKDK